MAEKKAIGAARKPAGQAAGAARTPGGGTDPVIARMVAIMRDIPGVRAIGLGGSRSIGTATAGSDYDIILFSRTESELDKEAVARAIEQFGAKWPDEKRKPLAELTVDGRKVELLFRNFDRIAAEIAAARKGQFRRMLNPLHTVGFLSTIVISYATYIRPLWDPEGELKSLMESAFPYPDALRERMIKTFRTEAKLALMHAGKVRSIHDIAHLLGLYARANAAWALVLFAVNRRYPVIDKGGRQLVASFPVCPTNYEFRTMSIFRAAAGGDLKGAIEAANRLHGEIVQMSQGRVRKPGAEAGAAPAAG